MQEKRVLISGGSGFIGTYLNKRFSESGYVVKIVSRSGQDLFWGLEQLSSELNQTDILINLAGSTINTRFNKKNREKIVQSRVETTELLHQAIELCNTPPKLWLNASATGIYAHTYFDKILHEFSDQYANDFLCEVTRKWEASFFRKNLAETRQIALRTSVVLGKSGGAFLKFNLLTSLGLGGTQGSGKQMISWIHIEDYFQIILHLIANNEITGVVNMASPHPVSNKLFMKTLRKVKSKPFGLPAPAFLLRLAMPVIGIEPSLVLDSTNVFSIRLKEQNFQFKYPTAEKAFEDLTTK